MALPLAAAAWRLLRRGRKSGIRFSAVRRLPARTAGWRAKAAGLAPWLFLAGAAALVLAAARPRQPLGRDRRNVDAIAIAMTVDVSGSMDALDLSPKDVTSLADCKTRLDVVKDMFATFVASRPDDLIGLVTFGGYASSRAPLTADHETLLHVLKGVEIPSQSFDAQGNPVDPEETMTAVGDGLSMALARLKNAEVKSKIVILLSDGVSNTGAVEPAQAAEAAAKMGIKAYVIGVGTKSRRVPCRVKDAFGRWTVAYADMAFDESQLKSIAKTTGGRYFAVDDADGLKAALEEIDSLEKTTLDRTTYQRYREFFPPFLLWGAALVLAAISIQMAASRRLL
ncbi:MAG: VWA domain-containing protein [Kiritimatiellae bacterium]|nr:VWA domain-containing protein [Kiritimatiellia bacterium]